MKSKLNNGFTLILRICLLIFALLMTLGALICVKQLIFSGAWSTPKRTLAVFMLTLGLIYASCYLLFKIPDRTVTNRLVVVVLLVIFGILFLSWVYNTPVKQTSDYYTFWKYGRQAVLGGPIYYHDNNYFAKWAYQTGFLTYVMAVIKLFGAHLRVLQFLNVLWQLVALVLTYKLAQRLFHYTAISRISLFLLGINWEWLALNGRLTNQYLALVFFLLTWILLLNDNWTSWLAAGVTLALGNIVRPLGIVFLAGIIVFSIVYRILARSESWQQNLVSLLSLILVYFLVIAASGSLIKQSGLNEFGLKNRDSEWKFVIGLNYPSRGSYSQPLVKEFNLKDSRAVMLKQEKQVNQRHIRYLNKHHLWASLFLQKFFTVWSNPSNTLSFSLFDHNHSPQQVRQANLWSYAITVSEIWLVLMGAFTLAGHKYPNSFNLLLLILFAYAAAQVIIEVQGRYRLEFEPVLVIIAAVGLTQLYSPQHLNLVPTLQDGGETNWSQVS